MVHFSKTAKRLICVLFMVASLIPSLVLAQDEDPEFTIGLRRDFGYGGFANDIEGLFTIRASGPDDLIQVTFYIDNQVMAEVLQEPFSHQFRTEEYDLGAHTFHAVGLRASGDALRSNEISATFVSPEAGRGTAVTIVLVVLGLVLVATLISGAVTMLTRRGSKSEGKVPVAYGALGGAICPKCNKPFSRHWWGLNVVVGKYDRCPHCGKWSIVRRAYPEALRLAEQLMEKNSEKALTPDKKAESDLKRDLDDSKFMD